MLPYPNRVKYLVACLGLFAVGCGEQDPYFESVLAPSDTYDTLGPYLIQAFVNAPAGVSRVTLRVTENPFDERYGDIELTRAALAGHRDRGRPPHGAGRAVDR